MTGWKFLYFGVDQSQRLFTFNLVCAGFRGLGAFFGFVAFEQVEVFLVLVVAADAGKQADQVVRTFSRRKKSWMVFCRMRWNSRGSSLAGLSPYFSASLIIAS